MLTRFGGMFHQGACDLQRIGIDREDFLQNAVGTDVFEIVAE